MVWNYLKCKFVSPSTHHGGYKRVSICGRTIGVHRLVAMAFHPNSLNKPEVTHVDCNPSNNRVSNLEWVARRENLGHRVKNGSLPPIMDDATVHCICQALEFGRSTTELARQYNVSHDAIFQIKRGINWRHISSQYNIQGPVTYNKKLTEDQVHDICKGLLEGKDPKELADMYGTNKDVIWKIRDDVNWKKLVNRILHN